MTCILGYIDSKNNGHIVSDKLGSSRSTKTSYSQPKIFRNGELIIGYAGSFRMGQILEHCLRPPKNYENIEPLSYLISMFIPAVRQAFEHHGFLRRDQSEFYGSFLVIYRNRLFTVQQDFSVLEKEEKFASVGSGECYAVGAFNALLSTLGTKELEKSTEKYLRKCIEITAQYSPSVGEKTDYFTESNVPVIPENLEAEETETE